VLAELRAKAEPEEPEDQSLGDDLPKLVSELATVVDGLLHRLTVLEQHFDTHRFAKHS
jgi:hypothetical protein